MEHDTHGRCSGSYHGARAGTELAWGPDYCEHWARVEDYHSEGSQQQQEAYMESHLRLINCAPSNQRLCPFYRLGFCSSLCAGFATIGTLMSFLAPEHDSVCLGSYTLRGAPQVSFFICSSSQGVH